MVSAQIAGTDPSFGFSRVCDETPSKRPFNDIATAVSVSFFTSTFFALDDIAESLYPVAQWQVPRAHSEYLTKCYQTP